MTIAARYAWSATQRGLTRGRVYQHQLASGEAITVGPDRRADGSTGYAIHGYHRGACRTETFGGASSAALRFVKLATGGEK